MIEVSIRNRHGKRVDRRFLREVVRAVLRDCLAVTDGCLGIHLISAGEIAELNERFLRHRGSTDVLTFDHQGESGLYAEIFISLDDTLVQARQFRTSWTDELIRYVIHGLLHLQGFRDDRPAERRLMKARENQTLRRIKARFSLDRLAGGPRGGARPTPP